MTHRLTARSWSRTRPTSQGAKNPKRSNTMNAPSFHNDKACLLGPGIYVLALVGVPSHNLGVIQVGATCQHPHELTSPQLVVIVQSNAVH